MASLPAQQVDGEGGGVTICTFSVIGTPVQQGSKRHVGNGRMIEAANGHREWRHSVAVEAARVAAELPDAPIDRPVCVALQFRFTMPKSRRKATRDAGVGWRSTTPDVDKLCRSILDSCQTAGLLLDDARVSLLLASKIEVTDWAGVHVTIYDLDAPPAVAA